jgi:hypothetical protein
VNHADRAALRARLTERIRTSRDPQAFLRVLLAVCVEQGGPDGLDLAIDLLIPLPEQVLDYARAWWKADHARWSQASAKPHTNDDVWYVLLRSLGHSRLPEFDKLAVIFYCAIEGTPSIREAAMHALGDTNTDASYRRIERLLAGESHPAVRDTALALLEDRKR